MPDSVIFRPYRVFFAAILLIWPIHALVPIIQVLPLPYSLVGAVVTVLGIGMGIRWSATVAEHRQSGLYTARPSVLITTGPFRISRHPLYTGMMAIVLGVALMLGSLSALLVVGAAWALMNWYGIPPEERALEEVFGDKYDEYRQRVRRWI